MPKQSEMLSELQVFEGAIPPKGGFQRRSRRLSEENIESLRRGDGKYKRNNSQLRELMKAGQLQYTVDDLEKIFGADDQKNVDEILNFQNDKTQKTTTTSSSFLDVDVEVEEEKDLEEDETKGDKEEEAVITNIGNNETVVVQCRIKSVSWANEVQVHYHEMILGYNTGVSKGAPVEIGWKEIDFELCQLNEKFSRTMQQLQIPPSRRMDICRQGGATGVTIMQRIEAVDILRQQLTASIKKAKMEDRKAMLKAKKEAAKMAKKKKKQDAGAGADAGADAGDGCGCIIQ